MTGTAPDGWEEQVHLVCSRVSPAPDGVPAGNAPSNPLAEKTNRKTALKAWARCGPGLGSREGTGHIHPGGERRKATPARARSGGGHRSGRRSPDRSVTGGGGQGQEPRGRQPVCVGAGGEQVPRAAAGKVVVAHADPGRTGCRLPRHGGPRRARQSWSGGGGRQQPGAVAAAPTGGTARQGAGLGLSRVPGAWPWGDSGRRTVAQGERGP